MRIDWWTTNHVQFSLTGSKKSRQPWKLGWQHWLACDRSWECVIVSWTRRGCCTIFLGVKVTLTSKCHAKFSGKSGCGVCLGLRQGCLQKRECARNERHSLLLVGRGDHKQKHYKICEACSTICNGISCNWYISSMLMMKLMTIARLIVQFRWFRFLVCAFGYLHPIMKCDEDDTNSIHTRATKWQISYMITMTWYGIFAAGIWLQRICDSKSAVGP